MFKWASLLFFTLSFLGLSNINQFTYPESITMLNVANGNSLIGRINNKFYIFDAGAGFGKSQKIFSNYLVYYGINTIDHVFISHRHSDHYNQLDNIKKVAKVKNESWNYKNNKELWSENNINFNCFSNMNYDDENSKSQIVYFSHNNLGFIFPGDATNETLNELARNNKFTNFISKYPIDLLVSPHHGSKTSNSIQFLAKTLPRNIFFSCNYQKNRPFPDKTTIDYTNRVGIKNIYISGNQNSYRYLFSNNKIVIL